MVGATVGVAVGVSFPFSSGTSLLGSLVGEAVGSFSGSLSLLIFSGALPLSFSSEGAALGDFPLSTLPSLVGLGSSFSLGAAIGDNVGDLDSLSVSTTTIGGGTTIAIGRFVGGSVLDTTGRTVGEDVGTVFEFGVGLFRSAVKGVGARLPSNLSSDEALLLLDREESFSIPGHVVPNVHKIPPTPIIKINATSI